MLNHKFQILLVIVISLFACACGTDTSKQGDPIKKGVVNATVRLSPEFSGDSAYFSIKKQVEFGPRIPGSLAHKKCSDYIVNEMKKYTSDLQYNAGKVTAYDGKVLDIQNIIGTFNREMKKRILVSAHYDTRPWADNDMYEVNRKLPVPGANDGASGVAVLLEIARILALKNPQVGVDVIFWDVEDYGQISGDIENTFCYGSQHWARNKHVNGYTAEFGINLDMVGATGARFTREGFSRQYAEQYVNLVWGVAAELGYSNYFVNFNDPPITDDHYYVSTLGGIPCIDIIDLPVGTPTFFPHWHTVNDDLPVISSAPLKAVGQTVLEVIYRQGSPPL